VSGSHYRVRIAESAKTDLRRIGKKYGKKTYEVIRDLIQSLEFEPDKKGEPLTGPLRGLFSLHYSRFRIIYRIANDELVVFVVATGFHSSGSRKDIYKLLERAIESGSLDFEADSADED